MNNTHVPLISSGTAGPLGVIHLPRLWLKTSLEATGESKLSKGVLLAIPLHLIYTAENIQLKKDKKLTWQISLEVLK